MTRRRLSEAYDLLREDLVAAVQVLGQVVRDEDAPPKDRIKAAELIMDHVMGKAAVEVEVQPRTQFEEFPPSLCRVCAGCGAPRGPTRLNR